MDWKMLAAIASILTVWSGVSFWAIKFMITSQLASHRKYTDEKFSNLATLISVQADDIKKFERDLMQLKIDLPNTYVRREDWIRTASTIDAKMDTHREALTNTNLRVENLTEKVSQFISREESK